MDAPGGSSLRPPKRLRDRSPRRMTDESPQCDRLANSGPASSIAACSSRACGSSSSSARRRRERLLRHEREDQFLDRVVEISLDPRQDSRERPPHVPVHMVFVDLLDLGDAEPRMGIVRSLVPSEVVERLLREETDVGRILVRVRMLVVGNLDRDDRPGSRHPIHLLHHPDRVWGCSTRWIARTSSIVLSLKGHGKRVKSHTRSTPGRRARSTFTNPLRMSRPLPRFSFQEDTEHPPSSSSSRSACGTIYNSDAPLPRPRSDFGRAKRCASRSSTTTSRRSAGESGSPSHWRRGLTQTSSQRSRILHCRRERGSPVSVSSRWALSSSSPP